MNQYLKCPCGKGKVSRGLWKNQWGKTGETISIECADCAEKYKTYIMEKGLFLLVPKEVPIDYQGYVMEDDYPYSKPYTTTRFDLYLIENYTRDELLETLRDITENKSSKKLVTEVANKLVDEFGRNKGSKKMKLVKETINEALSQYESYQYGNKEQRIEAKKIENENREKHVHELEDVSVRYDFRNLSDN